MNHWLSGVTSSMEFTEVFARGVEGVDPLSPSEAAWFRFTIFEIFKVAEDMHFQHDEGILDAAQWNGWRWVFAQYLASPGGRSFWEVGNEAFSPRFNAFYQSLQPSSTFKRGGALLEPRTP